MIQAIEKRKSQRTFTKEAIAEDKIQKNKRTYRRYKQKFGT